MGHGQTANPFLVFLIISIKLSLICLVKKQKVMIYYLYCNYTSIEVATSSMMGNST